MTESLRNTSYWASYNRGWFEDVRTHMGAVDAEEMHGALFSRDRSPRANIFRATQSTVHDLDTFKQEMRRNRWPLEVDGGAGNTPDHAIAARSDVDPQHPFPNGAVDAKVANLAMLKALKCDAVCGPTRGGLAPSERVLGASAEGRKEKELPAFSWLDSQGHEKFPDVPHEGMPTVYNFDWVSMG